MARTRSSLAWLVATTMAAAACNTISGLDEEYVLRGATLPGDGGGEDADASSSDLDGGEDAPDVVVVEAGPDADAGADADAGSWCPATASWCENWDETTATWDREEIAGGALTVDPGAGVNGSKALHAHANSVSMSRRMSRWRAIPMSPNATKYWVKFRFRLVGVGIDYGVIGGLQANNTAQTNTEYGLAAYKGCPGGTDCLDENNPAEEGAHPFSGQVAYDDAWHSAEITVEKMANTYLGTVKVDGTAVDTNGPTFFGIPTQPTLIEVGVGLFFTASDTGTADVFIDDVIAGHTP